MEITISGKNISHLEQVEKLAKKLGLTIRHKKTVSETDQQPDTQKAIAALKELIKINAFSEIEDPSPGRKK